MAPPKPKTKVEKYNIDVASSAAKEAESIQKIPRIIYVNSVKDAVTKIIERLDSGSKPGRILRLRFFGHGCVIGDKAMAGILLGTPAAGGAANAIADNEGALMGKAELERLKPYIRKYSTLELHQCNAGGEVGKQSVTRLVRKVADALDTVVSAGIGEQRTGPKTTDKFEGTRVQADGRGGKKPLIEYEKMEE